MKIFFVGHFGARNLGDELLLYAQMQLFEQLKDESISPYVYSYDSNTSYYEKYPWKVTQVVGFSFKRIFGSIISIWKAVRSSDFLIVGGGGIIQDKYFVYRPLSTLLPAFLAFIQNKPVYGFSLGIYKLNLGLNRRLVRNFLFHSRYVTYRDQTSEKTIKNLLLIDRLSDNIREIPDSAIGIGYSEQDSVNDLSENYILVAIREVFEDKMPELSKLILAKSEELSVRNLCLVKFENSIEESEVLKKLYTLLEGSLHVEVIDFPSVMEYIGLIKNASFIFAGRLHACIPSYVFSIHSQGLAYEEKVSDFCEKYGISYSSMTNLLKQKNTTSIRPIDSEKERLKEFVQFIEEDYKKKKKIGLWNKVQLIGLLIRTIISNFFIHWLNIEYREKE